MKEMLRNNKKYKILIIIITLILICCLSFTILFTFFKYNNLQGEIKDIKSEFVNLDNNKEHINKLSNIEENLKKWDDIDNIDEEYTLLNVRRLKLLEKVESLEKEISSSNIEEDYKKINYDYEQLTKDMDKKLTEDEVRVKTVFVSACSQSQNINSQVKNKTLYERYIVLEPYFDILSTDNLASHMEYQKYIYIIDGVDVNFEYSYLFDDGQIYENEICISKEDDSANQENLYFSMKDIKNRIVGFELLEANLISNNELEMLIRYEYPMASGAGEEVFKANIKFNKDAGKVLKYNKSPEMLRAADEQNIFVINTDSNYYMVYFYDRTRSSNFRDKVTKISKYDKDLNLVKEVSKNYNFTREETGKIEAFVGFGWKYGDYVVYNDGQFEYYMQYNEYPNSTLNFKHYVLDKDLNVLLEEDITQDVYDNNKERNIIDKNQYMQVIDPIEVSK